MPVEVVKYTVKYERQWDEFAASANNGTLFHLREFLNYHPSQRFTDSSLVFTCKGKMLAVFPAAVVDYNGERTLFSHPGASYGGIVISGSAGLKDTLEIVHMIINHARELHCSRIIITAPPLYYYRTFSSYVDFSLQTSGFTYRIRELSSVLSLNRGSNAIYLNFSDSVKRAIRKAEKSHLTVCQSDDLKSYYTILKNNLEMRHNVSPTHTQDELERLFDSFSDRIKLYAAALDGKMIGGIVTFGCNVRVNLAFYIAHSHDYQSLRPVDFIIWRLIQESIEQEYSYLDFGTFTLHMKPNWGLCRFKEKFGARGIFRDTLELKI